MMPYITVENASALLQFMKKVFHAEEAYKAMRDDKKDVIMHAEVKIGSSTIMLAEAPEQSKICPAGLFIYVENADETYQKAVKEGAASVQIPADQPYGRSCGVKDPFGNIWWITSVPES